MTALVLTLCLVCQLFMVGGQLFLKRAMSPGAEVLSPAQRVRRFAAAIGCLSVWFFLWLGVLQRLPLSRAFPFEGLNPAMTAIGAAVLLKERLPLKAWAGVGLICVGIVIVAVS